mmetsp:Transcript_94295/g.172859  ORF Transcript_94295/g.172859 Transcript_94295/m.172859 type:complete len:89 (+) Transcript_94295:99-365(+)
MHSSTAVQESQEPSNVQHQLDRTFFLKSTSSWIMCVARSKLAKFGNILASASSLSTPSHLATGTSILSQGYLGITRPRPDVIYSLSVL